MLRFAIFAFSAGTSTVIVTVAWSFGFASQCLKLVPGLKFLVVKSFYEAFAFFPFKKHNHFVAHGQNVYDFTFTFRCDHPLVALGQFLTGLNILLILLNETTTQASTHARNFVWRERNTLLFCHLDGDRGEVCEELGTTPCFEPTSTHTNDDLCHIAWTDLLHFDMSVRVDVMHIFFERLEVDLF